MGFIPNAAEGSERQRLEHHPTLPLCYVHLNNETKTYFSCTSFFSLLSPVLYNLCFLSRILCTSFLPIFVLACCNVPEPTDSTEKSKKKKKKTTEIETGVLFIVNSYDNDGSHCARVIAYPVPCPSQ